MAAPNALLVMGVSGSGKSTVGALLASELGWKFYDADDYHPEENRMKMQKGIALNDKDRIPWLCKLHDTLRRTQIRQIWILDSLTRHVAVPQTADSPQKRKRKLLPLVRRRAKQAIKTAAHREPRAGSA